MVNKASEPGEEAGTPRIESLRVRNYRALEDVELKNITPLTVLLGPNGSGKSTIFDVFSFLSECFLNGLRQAWEKRGRAKEIKSRGRDGPVVIEIKYRERRKLPLITFHLGLDEKDGKVTVVEESLSWSRKGRGRPFRFLSHRAGVGYAVGGEEPDESGARSEIRLRSSDVIAVNTLGQFAEHPRVAALREFITDWYISYLSIDETRGRPEAGPSERLSRSGDNLPNVIQYLQEHHPDRLEGIFQTLGVRVPRLEKVFADTMPDGRLLLQVKDAPFDRPILSKYASDGTLKMLAYLVLLRGPEPPRFIGVEEPENYLHPRLLPELAEECREASGRSQFLVTTHSPFFLNALLAHEVRVLYRDEAGFTQVVRASDIPGIPDFMETGGALGQLWLEGRFGVGDPLVHAGGPGRKGAAK